MKIKHDFHIHTDLSLCANETATLSNYLEIAKKLDLKKLGFADHFWDEKIDGASCWYQAQNFEHICELKETIAKTPHDGIEIYFGCETEYDPYHRGVAITQERAEQMDFIIVPNSHTHMMMPKDFYEPYQKHVNFMIQAYEDIINSNVSRYITAMAHPFGAVCCPYPNSILIDMITDDQFKRLFDKTAEKGIAIEINVASMMKKTTDEIEKCSQIRLFRLAKECGCKFTFGSDAHSNTAHDTYHNADFVAKLLDLTENDLADIVKK